MKGHAASCAARAAAACATGILAALLAMTGTAACNRDYLPPQGLGRVASSTRDTTAAEQRARWLSAGRLLSKAKTESEWWRARISEHGSKLRLEFGADSLYRCTLFFGDDGHPRRLADCDNEFWEILDRSIPLRCRSEGRQHRCAGTLQRRSNYEEGLGVQRLSFELSFDELDPLGVSLDAAEFGAAQQRARQWVDALVSRDFKALRANSGLPLLRLWLEPTRRPPCEVEGKLLAEDSRTLQSLAACSTLAGFSAQQRPATDWDAPVRDDFLKSALADVQDESYFDKDPDQVRQLLRDFAVSARFVRARFQQQLPRGSRTDFELYLGLDSKNLVRVAYLTWDQ